MRGHSLPITCNLWQPGIITQHQFETDPITAIILQLLNVHLCLSYVRCFAATNFKSILLGFYMTEKLKVVHNCKVEGFSNLLQIQIQWNQQQKSVFLTLLVLSAVMMEKQSMILPLPCFTFEMECLDCSVLPFHHAYCCVDRSKGLFLSSYDQGISFTLLRRAKRSTASKNVRLAVTNYYWGMANHSSSLYYMMYIWHRIICQI